ncbi:MAG TPA: response regulator transcription factor [Rhodothermales bacterium]
MQPIDMGPGRSGSSDTVLAEEDDTGIARILIVDDQPLARMGLTLTIEAEKDMRVCCESSCVDEILEGFEERTPDLAIVDISGGGGNGVDVVRKLHIARPNLPILVLSWHDDPLHAAHALRAGARGYLTRSEDAETVITAIRRLLRGGLFVSDSLHEKLLLGLACEPDTLLLSPPEVLSKRELQVFEMTGRGLGTSEIARRLNVSVKTIESYRHRIKAKLHLRTATELVQNAVRWVDGERTF